MTPALGQLWRVRASGNVYRVAALRLDDPNPYNRVELELVERGHLAHVQTHVGDRFLSAVSAHPWTSALLSVWTLCALSILRGRST